MNHIELFAGCGGLSLGLHAAGFELLMANELSPMAAESFTYNFFDEDLAFLAEQKKSAKKTLWINSRFKELKPRLRENPLLYSIANDEAYSDIPENKYEIKGKLLVGSIIKLNRILDADYFFQNTLRSGFGLSGVDLVSGGAPCQSFSMAGLRKKDCEKNTLPLEFAKFVSFAKPKIAMLENVTGILRAFKDSEGNSYHAWYEVAKTFASIGYVPLCLHINARLVGVAQNRPRFIMLAFRHDCYKILMTNLKTSSERELLVKSGEFYQILQKQGEALEFGHLNFFDVSKKSDYTLFSKSFLSPLIGGTEVCVKDALDDLRFNTQSKPSSYIQELNAKFNWLPQSKKINNHEPRSNSDIVKRRFRLYQVLQKINDQTITKDISSILKGKALSIQETTWDACKKFRFLSDLGELKYFATKEDFVNYLIKHPTKKQTQKALNPTIPAPAVLSIADDICHYDEQELRVLTVREMARIQSFPDNFIFRSKVTTGGQMRKFEVPQYTQVGNAVPPILGRALGFVIKELLSRL